MSSQEPELHLTTSLSPGQIFQAQHEATETIVHPPTPVAPVWYLGATVAAVDLQGLLNIAPEAVREAGLAVSPNIPTGDPQRPWLVASSEAAVVLVSCVTIDRDHSYALVFATSSDSSTAENARNQVRSAIDRLAAASPLIDHPEQGLQAEPE
jgi:hypothetical protein